MGRPINKKWFGKLSENGVQLSLYVNDGAGGIKEETIVSQKGVNKYVTESGKIVRLVAKDSDLEDNEAFIKCIDQYGSEDYVLRIYQRTMLTSNKARFAWETEKTSIYSNILRLITRDFDDPLRVSSYIVQLTNTHLHRNTNLDGGANSKRFIFWTRIRKLDDITGSIIFSGAVDSIDGLIQLYILLDDNGTILFHIADLENILLVAPFVIGALTTADGFKNLMISVDTSEPRVQISLDDDIIYNSTNIANDQIGFKSKTGYQADWSIGAQHILPNAPTDFVSIETTGIYFSIEDSFDLTLAASRRIFFRENGLQSTLEDAPIPLIQFTGDADAWNTGTNEGTGGDFILLSGAVIDIETI